MVNKDSVLIVILNYQTYDMTLRLVEMLQKLEYSNYQVLVIDNASSNASAEILAKDAKEKGYLFHSNVRNSGYAAGNNVGIRYAIKNNFEYSWILNNDVELCDQQILQKMVRILQDNPDVGAVGPKIYDMEKEVCSPYCNRPTRWSMTLGVLAEKKYREKQNDISQKVYRVHGCSMLLRNSVMQQIDCMDERTFLYYEEDILAERMRQVDSSFYYCAQANIIHMESSTVKKTDRTRGKAKIKIVMRSMTIYLKDYRRYDPLSTAICKIFKRLILQIKG